MPPISTGTPPGGRIGPPTCGTSTVDGRLLCWGGNDVGQLDTVDIAAAHALMVAHGDGNKQIWMTELGAPTGTASNAVSEKKQALAIGKIVEFARQYSYIGPIYMYSLLDTGTNLADPEDNFGLLRTNFTAKLAWAIWLLDQDDLETLLNSLSL